MYERIKAVDKSEQNMQQINAVIMLINGSHTCTLFFKRLAWQLKLAN